MERPACRARRAAASADVTAFVKVGIPLILLFRTIAMLLIPRLWPF